MANTGRPIGRLLADAGYRSESNFAQLEKADIDGFIPVGKRPPQRQAARMKRWLATKRGRAWYRQREWLAEPVRGWIKSVLGFRAFSMRGKAKVDGEWNLVSLATNLRRLHCRMAT